MSVSAEITPSRLKTQSCCIPEIRSVTYDGGFTVLDCLCFYDCASKYSKEKANAQIAVH